MKRLNKKGGMFEVISAIVLGLFFLGLILYLILPKNSEAINVRDERTSCGGSGLGTCRSECNFDENELPTTDGINLGKNLCPPKTNLTLTKCCISSRT